VHVLCNDACLSHMSSTSCMARGLHNAAWLLEHEGICCSACRRTWVHRTRRVRLRMALRLFHGPTLAPRHVCCDLILIQPAHLPLAQLQATQCPYMCREAYVRRHWLCAMPSVLCLSGFACLTNDSNVLQARENTGGFFQDNRKLSIVELDPDRFGPAKWVEE